MEFVKLAAAAEVALLETLLLLLLLLNFLIRAVFDQLGLADFRP